MTKNDFTNFDHLICMDEDNREHLLNMAYRHSKFAAPGMRWEFSGAGSARARITGGADGFDLVYRLVDKACDALIDELLADQR